MAWASCSKRVKKLGAETHGCDAWKIAFHHQVPHSYYRSLAIPVITLWVSGTMRGDPDMTRGNTTGIRSRVAIAAAACILAACSPSADPATPASFWQGFSRDAVLEANPPQSTEDLADRSTLIVTGSIHKVEPGPETHRDFPEGEAVEYSAVVTVDVKDVLKGTWKDATIPVHMFSAGPVDSSALDLPKEDGLWFLEPAGIADYYMATASAGVWMEQDGSLTTVRDPAQAELVIPQGVETIDEATRSVVQSAASSEPAAPDSREGPRLR